MVKFFLFSIYFFLLKKDIPTVYPNYLVCVFLLPSLSFLFYGLPSCNMPLCYWKIGCWFTCSWLLMYFLSVFWTLQHQFVAGKFTFFFDKCYYVLGNWGYFYIVHAYLILSSPHPKIFCVWSCLNNIVKCPGLLVSFLWAVYVTICKEREDDR